MDNLEGMDKFLETHNLSRLNKEYLDNLNRLITSFEIEFIINKFPAIKSPGLDIFTGEFYQIYKKEPILLLLKLFQMTEEDETLPNSLYKATTTLIPKPDKDTTKKKITGQYFY